MATRLFDWGTDSLCGFEGMKNVHLVAALQKALQNGEDLGEFSLFSLGDNQWMLSDAFRGCHHRAMALFLTRTPFRYRQEKTISPTLRMHSIPVGSILLYDHLGDYDPHQRTADSHDFLERAADYPLVDQEVVRKTREWLEGR